MKFKVMSFNIFCGILTEERISKVIEIITAESPDIVGLQEGMDSSVKMIREKLGDTYEILGNGRNEDKTGENCNVMYKKAVFDLMDTETLWLTDTPEEYSYVKDSCCPRILTYQLLKSKTEGQTILHVNTHLDHVLPEVRAIQAEILLGHIDRIFGSKYPTVITGDFNCEKTEAAFDVMTAKGYTATRDYGEDIPTYQGFGNGTFMDIDYIFTGDSLTVSSYRVCDEKIGGEHPSDHSAIVSEISLN